MNRNTYESPEIKLMNLPEDILTGSPDTPPVSGSGIVPDEKDW
jgi:hypothetical protein